MSILSEWYGEFVSQYSGLGTLNGTDCSFEIGQMKDGTIVLYSSVDILSAHGRDEVAIALVGVGEDENPIVARGKVSTGDKTLSEGSLYVARGAFEFTAGKVDWSRVQDIRFSLTNFLFCYSVGRTGELVNNILRLGATLDGIDVAFEKTSQYDGVWSNVGLGQGTVITCELIVRKGNQTREEIMRLSYAICDLLTIGAGRIINWICYEARDRNGSTVYAYHQNRYTNRKAGSELVDFSDPRTAVDFLEQCYPAYMNYNARHPGMLHRIGRLLLDLSTPEYDQTSALVAVAIVDALSKKESDSNVFRERLNSLRNANNMWLDGAEIDAFIQSRNSLAHEFGFHTEDAEGEYFHILNLLRRLLLSILDYQFEYYEVTKGERALNKRTLHRSPQ